MTVGFMGLFAAIIGERISQRAYTILVWPLILLGLFSAVYWILTESYGMGDLRMYIFVQFFTLLAIPLFILVGPPKFTHGYMIIIALLCYAFSKVAEYKDHEIWRLTEGVISGHTIKHLLAAFSCYVLLRMLQVRGPLLRSE